MKRVSGLVNQMSGMVRAARDTPAWGAMVEQAASHGTGVRRLPGFTEAGRLPAGVHDADLATFLLHVGGNDYRRELYAPFAQRLLQLRERGVEAVYVGGSGISAKPNPGDVDALFSLADRSKLPVRERLADWAAGTHWHGAERRHSSPQTAWGSYRPTWLEYFSNRATSELIEPMPVVRVVLNDARAGVGALVP
jgi:hypothetical protein